ncbi:MAG TPA: DUF4870 domain-containing protein [Rhodanobacteraceae bacterium]|jgi:uncharacterized Tic20 family protein|nr:DUF4870 domain-containing protein [Rhodanobacteraceae bacterium]
MSDNENVTPSAPPPQPTAAAPTDADERTWALLGHLSAFSAFITGLGCVIGPLIVWLVKRDTMPFAGEQALEALNFNITAIIAAVALGAFTLITLGIGALLTVPLALALFLGWFVLTIVAAVKANNGEHYRYPFSIRLVK